MYQELPLPLLPPRPVPHRLRSLYTCFVPSWQSNRDGRPGADQLSNARYVLKLAAGFKSETSLSSHHQAVARCAGNCLATDARLRSFSYPIRNVTVEALGAMFDITSDVSSAVDGWPLSTLVCRPVTLVAPRHTPALAWATL